MSNETNGSEQNEGASSERPWSDRMRQHVVEYVLEVRREYLAAGNSALTHWTQIEQRLRASARTCATAREWTADVARRLRLGAASSSRSSVMADLVATAHGRDRAFLDLVERESPLVIAEARLESEQIRKDKAALAAEGA